MSQFAKKLLCVLLLAVGAEQAKAFSLAGPLEAWQVINLGYAKPTDVAAADFVGPKNIGEEYRWDSPILVYAFDPSFIAYFGQAGVDAIEMAIKVLNDLPAFSGLSQELTEYPLDTRRFNYRALALGIRDMKSWTLSALLEAMGLGVPERWAYTLRAVLLNGGLAASTTIKRNFDPVTLLPSSYVNGTLYTYNVRAFDFVPDFEATEVAVDPLAPSVTSVVALQGLQTGGADFRGSGVLINPGLFYTGLTRDDVGGLRYIYNKSNFNVENVSSNAVSATGSAGGGGSPFLPVPGSPAGAVGAPGVGGAIGGGAVVTTNTLVGVALRPGPDKITFQRANFDSTLNAFVFTNTVFYTDTYITNGLTLKQLVRRNLTQPDILFSAADLGVSVINQLYPIMISRRIGFQNNTALNSVGATALAGPGTITGPVEITFSKVGPFLLNFGPFNEETATSGLVWGSFDGSTNAPVLFPRGMTIQDLEKIVLSGSGGTLSPWWPVGTGP
ncbi:MAG: hypothetical protein EXS23_03280 [Pedosphaera sp.]|nr:hypothetical protein [Pedosphaera sp.]